MPRVFLLLLLLISPVAAQERPPTMQEMQNIVTVIQNQRNQALTNHAIAQARVMVLEEENAKLKAELEEAKKGK